MVLNQKYNNFDKYIVEELINRDNIKKFEISKSYDDLPKIKIEIFLSLQSIPKNSQFFGVYHSDNPTFKGDSRHFKYGIVYECCFDEDFKDALLPSIQEGKIPYDFYKMTWKTFSNNQLKSQKKPLKILNIDNSNSNATGAFD